MKTFLIIGALLFFGACEESQINGAFKDDDVKVKVFLRSAPGDQQDITFKMQHFEILYEQEGEVGAVITGKKIDALSLKNMGQKIPLTMDPVKLNSGSQIKEIRLVLQPQDHFLRRLDGSECKLNLYNKETSITAPADSVRLQGGMNYALILELAADSIMLDLGEKGECTARPDFSFRALRPLDQLAMNSVDEIENEEDVDPEAEDGDQGI